jgi:hypothetical protein
MLIESLFAALATDSGMQAQLGTPATRSDSTTGIFPLLAPEEVSMPYLVVQQVSGEPLQVSYQGTGALQTTRWRFTCYGTTYKNAKVLARALKSVLVSLNGNYTTGNAQIMGSWLRLEADDSESVAHATIFATHVDVEINYLDNDD